MKKSLSLLIRLWGCLAHVPIITMIWTGYLIYCNCGTLSWKFFVSGFALPSASTVPIAPIVLTLCSIPISLGLMHFKRKSSFVYHNAQAAYVFNIWLIKGYALAVAGLMLGIGTQAMLVSLCFTGIVFALSLFSLAQSLVGVITALRGSIYRYWYPGE